MATKELPGQNQSNHIDRRFASFKKSLFDHNPELRSSLLKRAESDYSYIADTNIFTSMPIDIGTKILDSLDKLKDQENGDVLLKTAYHVFKSTASCELVINNPVDTIKRGFLFKGPDPENPAEDILHENIESLANNEGIIELLPYLFDKINQKSNSKDYKSKSIYATNKLTMAILLSTLTVGEISNKLSNQLGELSWLDYKVKPTHGQWYLCEDAEVKMEKQFAKKTGLILIDNAMLVKNNGYITGLCLKPIATPQGILMPGVWYSPTSKDFRNQISTAIDNNQPNFTTSEQTEWAVMRSVFLDATNKQSPTNFIKKAIDFSKILQTTN